MGRFTFGPGIGRPTVIQLEQLATECEQRGRAKEAGRLRLLAAIVNAAPDDQNIRNARNVIGQVRRALHPEKEPLNARFRDRQDMSRT